jgi:ferredoxin
MPITSSYYINAPTLSSATAVFMDSNLSVCAPDGYYRSGTTVRQQVSCVLLDALACGDCIVACNTNIIKANAEGVYNIDVEIGVGTGVVGILFTPNENVIGIEVSYDGVIYNKLSSESFGLLQGTAGLPTYIGQSSADCGIVAGSPFTTNNYDFLLDEFIPNGTAVTSVAAGQMQLSVDVPNVCGMVIPKPNATPSILSVKIIALCELSTFGITVYCPNTPYYTLKPYFSSEFSSVDSATACLDSISVDYYFYSLSGRDLYVDVYDFVFTDIYGLTPVPDGWYKADNDYVYEVTSGIVTDLLTCL